MKKIIFFSFAVIILKCLEINECTGNDSKIYHINTNSPDFKFEFEFDWTDDDQFDLIVPFAEAIEENKIIPFFINATVVANNIIEDGSILIYENEKIVLKENKNFENITFFPKDVKIEGNNLKVTVKSEEVMADSDDIKKKYVKYFGWAQCSGNNEAKMTISTIIGTFNNGNYFSLNTILFVGLVLLFI